MTEMAEIMMWFFEFRFWVLPLQLPKKREAFTSSSCTGLVRCLHQPNLRVQWLCCNSEILIWMEELKRAQCVGTMQRLQRLWKGCCRMLFFCLNGSGMFLECFGHWSEVRWSRMKSEVSGEVGALMKIWWDLSKEWALRVWSLTESDRTSTESVRFVSVLRRSGRDGHCVGLRHLRPAELRGGRAAGRNAWPRRSAAPHAVRSAAAVGLIQWD